MNHRTVDAGVEECPRSVVKGALAGMAGGLVASWLMDRLESVMKPSTPDESSPEGSSPEEANDPNRSREFTPPIGEEQLAQTTYSSSAPQAFGDGEEQQPAKPDATVRMANRISKTFLHHEVPEEKQDVAGKAVHYAFGTLIGGLYGAAAEMSPAVVSRFGGLPFGMALWILADELALPAFQLGDAPKDKPLKQHATGLATHFVYGATTDGVRRLLRRTAIH